MHAQTERKRKNGNTKPQAGTVNLTECREPYQWISANLHYFCNGSVRASRGAGCLAQRVPRVLPTAMDLKPKPLWGMVARGLIPIVVFVSVPIHRFVVYIG